MEIPNPIANVIALLIMMLIKELVSWWRKATKRQVGRAKPSVAPIVYKWGRHWFIALDLLMLLTSVIVAYRFTASTDPVTRAAVLVIAAWTASCFYWFSQFQRDWSAEES